MRLRKKLILIQILTASIVLVLARGIIRHDALVEAAQQEASENL